MLTKCVRSIALSEYDIGTMELACCNHTRALSFSISSDLGLASGVLDKGVNEACQDSAGRF